ncbi:DUF2325 domain-containing protein [Desulfovirgula thermocuniculi]|uniref:DUF2325 domain-containing protein n=1 Tax=Desulfovirgula thermocuniculi TaxID=348842 RepID=UPI0004294EE5|nr:DUF2325 domain-containing protein [Desulfovirgula thermocuniculi]
MGAHTDTGLDLERGRLDPGRWLEFLRAECAKRGVEVGFSERDFWWFCFAERAVAGLVAAAKRLDSWEWLLYLARVPPKKRKLGEAALVRYILSRFPSPGFKKRLERLAFYFFPECFGEGDPRKAVEAADREGRDAGAARFLCRALGKEAALPPGFDEGAARLRYEIYLREHALSARGADPLGEAIRREVEKSTRGYREEIARLREKLERSAELVRDREAEAEQCRRLAEEALALLEEAEARHRTEVAELEDFYRRELEALRRRVGELERELEQLSPAREGERDLPLAGRRVLVFGDPRREEEYAAELETLGAEAVFVDAGDKSFDESVVGRADLAVTCADYGSHAALDKLKSEARRRGVRVVTVPSGAPSEVARAALRHFLERGGN